MMNINDKTKRRLLIAGLCVICVGLIFAISSRFQTETPLDVGIALVPTVTGEVKPDVNLDGSAKGKEVIVQLDDPVTAPADKPADQTDRPVQNLQPDVTKLPEPSESQKTDPSKNPDGEKVDKVQAVDHGSVKKPDNPPPQSNEPKGGEKKDGKVYFPGFGWIDDEGGGSSGTTAEDMYENGNKIGNMN